VGAQSPFRLDFLSLLTLSGVTKKFIRFLPNALWREMGLAAEKFVLEICAVGPGKERS
jgi:hypothetical protein